MTYRVRPWRTGRRVASAGQPLPPRTERNCCACLVVAALTLAATTPAGAQNAPTELPTPAADPAPSASVNEAKPSKSATPRMPPGMVRYDHPILSNGKLILWHGAWRDRPGAKEPQSTAKDQPPTARDQSPSAAATASPKPSANGYALLADPSDACASRLAGDFVAALQSAGPQGKIVAGGVSAAGLAAAIDTDRADLAIASLDALVGDPQASAAWRERAPLIAKLSGEPIEIVAARDVNDIRQLAGREVGYGVADSAEAASATALFHALGVAARPAYEPLGDALGDLAAGRLAAVVVVDGRCAPAFAAFGADHRFHELATPWSPALRAAYAPARLSAKDRPNLIADGEKVDAVAAPRALIALDAAPGSARAQSAAALAKAFFSGFDRLLTPDKDSAWRDVNFAADAPWPRLRGAQEWIDAARPPSDASLEAFRTLARSAASADGGPGGKDSDRLYDSLMQWRGAGQ